MKTVKLLSLVALAVVLGVLLSGAAAAQECTATLTWTAPTENTDGSPLEDLAGFGLYWGDAPRAYDREVFAPSDATTYTVRVPSGTWYFAATAYNTGGVESLYSNEAMKTVGPCDPIEDPRPPEGVSFLADTMVVYDYAPRPNETRMLPAGEVPADTPCDRDEGVISQGVVYFAVPRELVSWYGTVQPDIVYAQCLSD